MKEPVQIGKFKVWTRQGREAQDLEIVEEVYTGDCYKLKHLSRLGFEPHLVLDIGGHIGSFALAVKSLWPSCKVIAFEPLKESFDLYKQNMAGNDLSDVEVLNLAVSYSPEKKYLLDGQGSTGGCVLKDLSEAQRLESEPEVEGVEHYHVVQSEVDTISLDDFLTQRNINRVDLAKIDCEGSEVELFHHISPKASSMIGFLAGEYHVQGGLNTLRDLGSQAFPHLHFFGGGDHPTVGPFWASRNPMTRYQFFALDKWNGIKRRLPLAV